MSFNLNNLQHEIMARESNLKYCQSALLNEHGDNQAAVKLLEHEVFFLEDQLGYYYQALGLLQDEQQINENAS